MSDVILDPNAAEHLQNVPWMERGARDWMVKATASYGLTFKVGGAYWEFVFRSREANLGAVVSFWGAGVGYGASLGRVRLGRDRSGAARRAEVEGALPSVGDVCIRGTGESWTQLGAREPFSIRDMDGAIGTIMSAGFTAHTSYSVFLLSAGHFFANRNLFELELAYDFGSGGGIPSLGANGLAGIWRVDWNKIEDLTLSCGTSAEEFNPELRQERAP